jgi:cytochrome c nitrite reductase small subunit
MSNDAVNAKGTQGTPRWPALPIVLAVAIGTLAGVGSYTFSYAKGFSYLSSDPSACVNCHIMQRQYDGWQKASHHQQAVCIDCHVPQDFVSKYLVKAENGWRHGKLFTTGGFVEPIEVKPAGRQILEDNCVRCHGSLTAEMAPGRELHAELAANDGGRVCTRCHADVGHGQRAGLGGPLLPEERERIRKLEARSHEKKP